MEIKNTLFLILDELKNTYINLNEKELQDLEDRIQKANKIYVAGVGRSLMMIRGLAMRLMHIGFTAYVIGETVTPAIEKGDLLIIASGSGETGTLTVIAEKCKSMDISLALITTNPKSTIGKMADSIVTVNAATPKLPGKKCESVQPGANTFEQSVLLIGDSLVIDIISNQNLNNNNAELMKRHANLE